MSLAYKEALKAAAENEAPVGAVVVRGGQVVGQAYNQKEKHQQTASHAEMLAIQQANLKLKNWRLEDCSLYVTLEPCWMCAGAIGSARFKKLIYACSDPKIGACSLNKNILHQFQWEVEVVSGVMEAPCFKLIQDFFKKIRKLNKLK